MVMDGVWQNDTVWRGLRRAILPAIPLLFRYRINCRLAAYSSLIWASSFSPSIYG